MSYTGHLSRIFWGVEGAEFRTSPDSDQHIPFNPMISAPDGKPTYTNAYEYTFDDLDTSIAYSTELTPKSVTFGPMVFKDPFLLLAFFTHKADSGTWGGGAATYGTLTGDFTDVDDIDTIWTQMHLDDKTTSADYDRLLGGGIPTSYKQSFKVGEYLKEEATILFRIVTTNVDAMACSNDFHDQSWGSAVGGWANWDDNARYPATGMSITWGGSAVNGVKIQEGDITINTPWSTDKTGANLYHDTKVQQPRSYVVNLTGFLSDLGEVDELEKAMSTKTKATLVWKYDSTANENKYIQITNMVVDSMSDIGIPASGEAVKCTITFKGGESCACSYSGTFENEPDPAAFVTGVS